MSGRASPCVQGSLIVLSHFSSAKRNLWISEDAKTVPAEGAMETHTGVWDRRAAKPTGKMMKAKAELMG